MSQYIPYQLEHCSLSKDITQLQFVCICCLQKDLQLISLKNCKHTNFLNNFAVPNIKIEDNVVCFQCHSVLKKIQEFSLRVQESFEILNNKTINISEIKPKRLRIEKTVDILIHQKDIQTDLQSLIDKEMEKKRERKLKNIETALDIIDSNNSMPLMGLINGIKNIKDDILGCTATDGLSVQSPRTPQSGDICDKHQDVASSTKSIRPNPIRKVKLTKRQLMREEYILSTSKQYLKCPFKCNTCIQGFNFKENLEDHIVRKHATVGQTCDICMQVLPEGIDMHMRRHFCRYVCVCRKMFVSRDEAVNHYARHHLRHKCEICGYAANDLKEMKIHRVKRHKFSCKQCAVVFPTSRRLRCHVMAKHKNPSSESLQNLPIPESQTIK